MTQTEALEMITKLQLAGQAMEAAGQRIDELKAENKALKEAAQRQWIGLTGDECAEFSSYLDWKSDAEVFELIETKLKAKNT